MQRMQGLMDETGTEPGYLLHTHCVPAYLRAASTILSHCLNNDSNKTEIPADARVFKIPKAQRSHTVLSYLQLCHAAVLGSCVKSEA